MIPKVIILGSLALISLLVFPRFLNLDAVRSPDEKRWLANTAGFTRKLAHGQWHQLVQQPHPGITTQWIGSLTIGSDNRAIQKLPLVIAQVILIIVIGYIFGLLWSPTSGLLIVVLLASNPLLYAHSRVYAMDSLLGLFTIASLGLLFLWHERKETRYLCAAAAAAAAATLSKLPGILLLPFTSLMFLYWTIIAPEKRPIITKYSLWLLCFIISLVVILPSFAIAPRNVIGDFTELFRSDDYNVLHQVGPTYYLRSLIFFSSPIHILLLLAPFALYRVKNKVHSKPSRQQIVFISTFALLFIVQMTIGLKKGDRYIMPSFLALDLIVVATIVTILNRYNNQKIIAAVLATTIITLTTQFAIIWKLHPHNLAYINPLSRPFFADRRHGWGEGLSLAAEYLNEKSNSHQLKVASYYPNEFSPYFNGETVPAHQHDTGNVDYVIIYRAMLERGPDAWETDLIEHYQTKTPEHIIKLSGIDFLWIHKIAANN